MTYSRAFAVALLVFGIAAPLAAQTPPGPNAPSRYAPRAIQAGPQPAVRQVAGQDPVREPQGPAASPQTQPLAGAIAPIDVSSGPQQPSWIPLAPDHEKWINQVLQYWETRSKKIKGLTCEFIRWEYDPVFGPKLPDGTPNPKQPLTIAKGEIKYREPDKGKFQVTELSRYSPPAKPGEQPQYVQQDAAFAEHWVSDGNVVFEFDARNKRMYQRELPPEMQGKAIADGPLPFLFGARAETIKARYWIHGLPQSGNGKYWLEAVPKSRQDAQNFKAVTIVLDEKTYLPELMEVLAPNYDCKTNPARTTYEFRKHEVIDDNTSGDLIRLLNPFKTAFYAPKLPSGWTRVMQRADGSTVAPGASGAIEATKLTPPRSPLPR